MSNRSSTILAFSVFVIWASSMIFDAFSKNYDPPAGIQAAFMLVLGWIVASKVNKNNEPK